MKSSSDNNSVLKSSNKLHDIKPFLLRSVYSSEDISRAAPGKEEESQKVKLDKEVFGKGFAEGIDAGRMQMLKELSHELNLLRSLIDGIRKLSAGIYGMIETDIVELSLSIARKIVYEVAEKDREVVVNTVKEAIKKTTDRGTIKIKISPVDYEIMSKNKSDLLQYFDGLKSISFDVDETIHPGGCMVETNHGEIDARIDSQFKIIEEELKSAALNTNTVLIESGESGEKC